MNGDGDTPIRIFIDAAAAYVLDAYPDEVVGLDDAGMDAFIDGRMTEHDRSVINRKFVLGVMGRNLDREFERFISQLYDGINRDIYEVYRDHDISINIEPGRETELKRRFVRDFLDLKFHYTDTEGMT